MIFSPTRGSRLAVASLVAAACGWASYATTLGVASRLNGGDFGYAWRAAKWLIAGESPYARMDPAAAYGAGGPFLYPLPAALVALPFAGLRAGMAASVFVALSAGLLAYALTARGWLRLLALASPPFLFSLQTANWPPLLTTAALLPGLGWLAPVKPNLGIVSLVYAPRRAALVGAALLVGLSMLLAPGWPAEWILHLRQQPVAHTPAVLWPAGALGLLGLLRWRTAEGRALAALTVIPTATLPYDWLMLWLCARTGKETVALTLVSWVAWGVLLAAAPVDLRRAWTEGHLILAAGWILPATILVLRRSNESRDADTVHARNTGVVSATPDAARSSSTTESPGRSI